MGGGVRAESGAWTIDALIGRMLGGRYELLCYLDRGGCGAVFAARNELGEPRAVKVLLNDEEMHSHRSLARFFGEARAAAAIQCAHIVNVFETGVDDGTGLAFIAMELLSGEDLERLTTRVGPLEPSLAARMIVHAARGLERAHEAGIVHRDVKPANLFLANVSGVEVVVKLLDFGVARSSEHRLLRAGLTTTGSALGTPMYMSPEQAQGDKSIDGRADIWSLGVCLFRALAGRTPWEETHTLASLFIQICSHDAPDLLSFAPHIPEKLAAIVRRTLIREPADRTPSARALIEELTPFCGATTRLTHDDLGSAWTVRDSARDASVALAPVTDAPPAPRTLRRHSRRRFADLALALGRAITLRGGGAGSSRSQSFDEAGRTYASAATTRVSIRTIGKPVELAPSGRRRGWVRVAVAGVVAFALGALAAVVVATHRRADPTRVSASHASIANTRTTERAQAPVTRGLPRVGAATVSASEAGTPSTSTSYQEAGASITPPSAPSRKSHE